MKSKVTLLTAVLCLAMWYAPITAEAATYSGDMDFAAGSLTGNLDTDGYAWDASTSALSLKDIEITGNVTLPANATVIVEGACKIDGNLEIGQTGTAANASLMQTSEASTEKGSLEVTGSVTAYCSDLTIKNMTLTTTEISDDGSSIGQSGKLSIADSVVNIDYMYWYADGGMTLSNSTLICANTLFDFMWVECISLDAESVIEIAGSICNYGHITDWGEDFLLYLPTGYKVGTVSGYVTVLDADGNIATGFKLERKYTVTVSWNNDSASSVSPATATVVKAGNQTFDFILGAGEAVVTVLLDGVDVTAQVTNNQYTLTDVRSNHTLEVTFGNSAYTVLYEANNGTGQTYQETATGDYTLKSSADLGFAIPEGKEFGGWESANASYATGDKVSLQADISLRAIWNDVSDAEDDDDDDDETEVEDLEALDVVPKTGEDFYGWLPSALFGLALCSFLAGRQLRKSEQENRVK